jgi:predicted nucleotidyltransferase
MTEAYALAQRISSSFSHLAMVKAVAIAGSQMTGMATPESDIDLYIYSDETVPIADRRRIATAGALKAEVDNQFWESGDEWIDRQTGIKADLMFRSRAWMEEQLERVLVRHAASVGYSTCFWHNLLVSHALFDREGWFAEVQERAACPYPEKLRQAIVDRNFPILDRALSAYTHQMEHAVLRGDLVSINHRTAAFLSSYFDILFAVNRLPHPGEKRLLALATELCPRRPADMPRQVTALLQAGCDARPEVVDRAVALAAGLELLLREEGLLED